MGRRSEETRVSELPHGSYCLFRVSWSLGLVFVWGDVSEKDLVKGGAPQTQAGAGAEEEPVLTEGTVPREEGPTRHASGAGKEEGHQG